MAAIDELPRGVTLSTSTSGASSQTVTFPATPGVSWVLTDIDAECSFNTAGEYYADITTSLGTGGPQTQIVFDVAASSYGSGSAEWSGKAVGAPGAALTVTVNASASMTIYLTAQAYPI